MNSDTQLTLSKIFEGKEIRAMYLNDEPWVPVVDLAEAWGVDRSTLNKIINRNKEVFSKLSTVVDVTSPIQNQPNQQMVGSSLRLVNEQGMHVLMLKVSAGHIKNPVAKERIIDFQLWIPELIQDLKKGMVVYTTPQIPAAPVNQLQYAKELLNHHLDLADIAVERSNVPKEIAHAMAFSLASEVSGTNLQPYASYIKAQSKQNLLPEPVIEVLPEDIADYERHFSLKKVAESQGIQKPENEIRNLMERLGIIYRENNMWHLTREGEKYGKVFFITPGAPYSTARKPWIKYNPTLIKLLRDYYNVKVPVTRIVG